MTAPADPRRGDPAAAPPTHGERPGPTPMRVLATIVGVVLVVAALKLSETVLVPLVAGLFLAVLARPLHRRLRDALPRPLRWLGLVGAMLVVVAGVGAFAAAIGWSAAAVTDELRARRPQIERQLGSVRAAAARIGVGIPGGASDSAGGGAAQAPGASAAGGQAGGASSSGASSSGASSGGGSPASGAAAGALRTVFTAIAGLLLALAFAALGLAEADDARRRIASVGTGGGARRTLAVIDEAAPAFRRYVWVKTLTSTITGLATALASLAFGLPLAWVWGFLAFLLEYVPTVGSLLAVAPPVLMALADGGPTHALLVLLVVGALQVILGNVVDPRLEGRLMSISPFGVLLSIVFWGWLWGAVGALLAVPLTVAVVIASRHTPGGRGVATIVAGDGVDDGKGGDAARGRDDRGAAGG